MYSEQKIIDYMCLEFLTLADIKSIAKARGLALGMGTDAKNTLSNVFSSEAGVRKAFKSLSPEEQMCLFFLRIEGGPVRVDFFAGTYNADYGHSSYCNTYTQKFKSVFSRIKTNLIRKGLLLIYFIPNTYNTLSKLERYRFSLPKNFYPLLEPPVDSVEFRQNSKNNSNSDAMRRALLSLTEDDSASSLYLREKKIYLEEKLFSRNGALSYILDSMKNHLRHTTPSIAKNYNCNEPSRSKNNEFKKFFRGVIEHLPNNREISSSGLDAFTRVFYYGEKGPTGKNILEAAAKSGFLEKRESDGEAYYAPRFFMTEADISIDKYLTKLDSGKIAINRDNIPFSALELLNQISFLEIRKELILTPDHISIGRLSPDLLKNPLPLWLDKNSDLFRESFSKTREKRGRQLIHENLLVAKINDQNLKIQIEKLLARREDCVSLSDSHIAFPKEKLHDILGILKKNELQIKTIEAQ